MELPELLQLANQFHRGILAVPTASRAIYMKDYPAGACGDASLLLGAYFADQGIGGFLYVRGNYGKHHELTHAWLQRGGCVVDITAGQFKDAPSPIVVASPSHWHDRFVPSKPTESDFRRYGASVIAQLGSMYGYVLENLARSESSGAG